MFGVSIIGEKSTSFGYGVRIVCSSLSQHGIEDRNESISKEVLLLDSRVGRPPIKRGYINLSRQVISVELSGRLGKIRCPALLSPSSLLFGHS